jgi:hypothetical protein
VESVRSGLPIDHDIPDTPDYRRQFTWAMHHRTLEIAPAIAAQVRLGRARTLLDLGGGPGTYAMAFLTRNSRLRATVCDREAALAVAKEIASTHRAGRRLSYLPLDFSKEPIPGIYDVIWYSNVLHIYSPEDNQAIFRRVFGTGWAIHHPRCVSARSRRFASGGGKFVCGVDVVVYDRRKHLSRLRDGEVAERSWIRWYQDIAAQEGDGGLGEWDFGGICSWPTSKSHRPPNTIKRKLKSPLIPLVIKE